LPGNKRMINLEHIAFGRFSPLWGQVWERSILEECPKLTINVRSISREFHVAESQDEQSPAVCTCQGNPNAVACNVHFGSDHLCKMHRPYSETSGALKKGENIRRRSTFKAMSISTTYAAWQTAFSLFSNLFFSSASWIDYSRM
jgi:hypothetical protein